MTLAAGLVNPCIASSSVSTADKLAGGLRNRTDEVGASPGDSAATTWISLSDESPAALTPDYVDATEEQAGCFELGGRCGELRCACQLLRGICEQKALGAQGAVLRSGFGRDLSRPEGLIHHREWGAL